MPEDRSGVTPECVACRSGARPGGLYDRAVTDLFEFLDTSALPVRQQRILAAIRDWVVRYGYSPSTREIGDAVGLRSSSTVSKHLASLEEKGFLRRGASVTRPIDVREFL